MSELVPERRVGDRERREVDAQLQEALADGVLTLTEYEERTGLCWAARTRSELDAVVQDLPRTASRLPALAPGEAPPARRVVGVLSESDLEVPVLPGQPVQAVAVLGTAKVDLRREDLPAEVHVSAIAVLGEVKVHVPPGTTVHLTGGAVMGERKVKTGPAAARGTVVHVNAVAVMGTVQVDDKARKGGLRPAATSWATARRTERRGPGRLLAKAAATVLPVAAVAGLLYGGLQVVSADDGVAVFGNRTVVVQPGDPQVEVGVLFGSVEVVVPLGARVTTDGTVVFGSVDCDPACDGGGGDVVVRGVGGFGSVEIVRAGDR